jgi:hypothetical protein
VENERATSIFDTLREPEQSEMVDFSGVFPAIRLHPVSESATKSADESGARAGRGIARAPVIVAPRSPRPRPQAYRSQSRIRSATLHQKYHTRLIGARGRGAETRSGSRQQSWPGEELLREWWAYLKLGAKERLLDLCCDYGLDRLANQGSAWGLARLRELGDIWGLEYLQKLESVEDLPSLWGPSVRQRIKPMLLWRPTLPVPGTINAHKSWKLLPVWMLVNLALLIAVLVAMAAQTLPRSLAGNTALSSSCNWHTVAAGETIYSISANYHLTAGTVAEANHLKSYGALHPGQQLCIPLAVPTLLAGSEDALVAPNLIATGPSVHGATQFIQFALPYAVSAHQQTGWPVSMLLAQWALEHGWTVPGFTGYNWGNVGALPGEPTVASGGAPGAPARFAYAPTPQDGVNYYVAVASLSFYNQVAPAARSGGPNAAARALGASPWDAAHYTGDGDPGDSLITIMSDFNLYRYD